ncbi:MAG: hypothetical protein QOH57_3691 [Mycobacterium sp.]|jgi:hypothetical protein|nr:hypothetical protein [Mycobacterium sp.]
MVSFDAVVGVLLQDMVSSRDEALDHAGIDRRPIRRDFDRYRSACQCSSEQRSSSLRVAARRDEDIDDLTVLIDRAVQVRPAAGDLHVKAFGGE